MMNPKKQKLFVSILAGILVVMMILPMLATIFVR